MRTMRAIVDLSRLPGRGRESNRRQGVNMIPRKIAKVDELSEEEKAYIFVNAKMCLVALTEFVQGPCFPNQLRVVEADYLRCARIILRDVREFVTSAALHIRQPSHSSRANQSAGAASQVGCKWRFYISVCCVY